MAHEHANTAGQDHAEHGGGHGTMGQLMLGFALAALLTIIPFALVMSEVEMSRTALVGIIMGLGAVQILVHLKLFLHLGQGEEQGWRMASAVFAAIILVIVLVGSLWVMHNMNENMMPMNMDIGSEAIVPGSMQMDHAPSGGHSADSHDPTTPNG